VSPASSRLHVLGYRAASLVHWKPRERVLVQELQGLAREGSGSRVIDTGCGLGQLAPVAAALGFQYLGLEPDPALLGHCLRHHPGPWSFQDGRAADLPGLVGPGDVVVLNGVAHHMEDQELRTAVDAARGGRALIVADHWNSPGRLSAVTRWLQARDRGKRVRAYSAFEQLEGFTLVSSRIFPIGPWDLPAWIYFCNHYRPGNGPARAPSDA
jgi:SAM-dependent methyltransferase